MSNTAAKKTSNGSVLEIVKALVISLAATLLLILLFSLCITWFEIPEAAIMPVNQVIKALSLLAGCLIGFSSANGGWRKGLITGILYVALAFIIFSILDGVFEFGWSLLIDIALGGIMGLICGIMAVNIRK